MIVPVIQSLVRQPGHRDLLRQYLIMLENFTKSVLTTLQDTPDGFNHLYCSVEVFPSAPGYIVQIVGLAIWKTNRNFKMILSRQLDRPFTYQTLNDFRIYNYEIGEFRLVLVKDRQVQHDFTAESKCWA